MEIAIKNTFKTALLFLCAGIIAACSTQKDTASNRALQNLSARYNYIYNSGVLLTDYENAFSESVSDTYEEILPVYLMPKGNAAAEDKSLTAVTAKAQAIISEKNVSNYLDDAYILLGKASYYQGNYFTATEYFDYVAKTYGANRPMNIKALTWKARSQFMLNNTKETKLILDTVAKELDSVKKHKAEALATIAQLQIHENKNEAAINLLKAALKQQHTAQETSRWEYIIGQLYERDKNYQESLNYYSKVVKSNAPFEMYFHANLNRIRVRGLINGEHINALDQLLALLKDDKNEEYTDQIYYMVAERYAQEGNQVKAEAYYLLSVAKSTKNQYQKGLSYLKIADINFQTSGNYLKAKLYYDSAVTTLPKTFPGYDVILKKDQNLQYLVDRYKIIAFQDTLQLIAALPETDRVTRINKIVAAETAAGMPKQVAATGTTGIAEPLKNMNDPFNAETTASTFYFSNAAALSNGYTDFKRKWGNRALQDNWRQSTRTASQAVSQNQNAAIINPVDTTATAGLPATGSVGMARQYLDALPLTPVLLEASNKKIIDAYFEIATFYLQELGDKKEAARIYELILARFPNNKYKEPIYYSLYRAYQGEDEANSERYKNLVLKEYPGSAYAKTILDPSYSIKASAAELAIQKNYNQVYSGYENKQYEKVINQVDDAVKTYPGNPLLAQYAYLRAIAIGRTNNVDSLLIVFNNIVTSYPDDKVITPLVKDHIAYINKNIYEFRSRKFALADFDTGTARFVAQNVPDNIPIVPQKAAEPVSQPKKEEQKEVAPPVKTTVTPLVTNPVVATVTPPATTDPAKPAVPAIKTDGTFTNAPATLYYFVVRVADASLTLSSSRFGIGQFNRGNYPDNNLRHQLTELDDDQLIYVGNFASLEAVKRYAESITPQLKNIMKVPAATYSAFIVSKENFDKIQSRDKIIQYLTFYTNSY